MYIPLQFSFESAGQIAVIAGSVVLVLMLVALGGFAYKSLRGGVEWPDEMEDDPGDERGVREGGDDDEWKYY